MAVFFRTWNPDRLQRRWRNFLRLLHTTVFRFALAYALGYSLIAGLLLGGIYFISNRFAHHQIDQQLIASQDVVLRLLRDDRRGDVRELLGQPARRLPGSPLIMVMDTHRRSLGGSLKAWPAGIPLRPGFYTFSLPALPASSHSFWRDADDHLARALVARLPHHAGWLLIAQPLAKVDAYNDLIFSLLLGALILITLTGLAGGILMGRGVLRRIDAVRDTAADIIAGDLEQRIPMNGRRDEFVDLGEHINAMLARIEALIQGMRAVTDNVAHDLRSPLNRLRSRIEVALMEAETPEDYRLVLEEATLELEGMVRTFNALLSIAQAESGIRRENLTSVDLSQLVSDLVELYEALAEEAGMRLRVKITPGVRIPGQRELLAQMLANLLDNAIKYNATGGLIEVTLTADEASVRLAVCDNGSGIPPEHRERVLERFARLDSARATPGNGLGLALVKAVAQVHGAKLVLSDARPGLCATLDFPTSSPLEHLNPKGAFRKAR